VHLNEKELYEILLAPFMFLIASIQTTYIENETDAMGQICPLDYEDELSDDEEEDESDE
jgi:hypothetical protein